MFACVHGRRMTPATAPLVVKVLDGMRKNGIAFTLEQSLAAWLRDHGHAESARTFDLNEAVP
mgnify:CR=1 FL=1